MKYISLFAGIGGFDLALDRLGHECVYTSEWDRHAAKVYETRFNRPVDTRDIRTVQTEEIPEHDLLVGGFPCQAFSVAGKRLGFDDTRGTLFFEIARILKDRQPKYFILENVKGLLSHNSGQTFRTIVSALTELGYDIQWNVLNSKNYGVAQNRERVYIVGHLRGQPRPEVFSFGESNNDTTKASEEDNITRTITTTHAHSWGWNISYVINQLTNPPHSGQRVYGTDGIAPTVTTGKKVWIPEGTVLRRLTEVECERLQGFPDNWTEKGLVFYSDKDYSNINVWNTVLSKIVTAKSKQISVPVLCTTKDIKDMEVLNFLKEKNLNDVHIVIDWQPQENSAINIIRIGIGTKTHFTQIKLENTTEIPSETNTGIYETLMANGDIEILWKNILGEVSVEKKSYIILTLINLIIGLKTCTSVQERNMVVFTTNLRNLLQNSLKTEQSILKTEHISSISSTQRYKCLGNAVTVNVVYEVAKNL